MRLHAERDIVRPSVRLSVVYVVVLHLNEYTYGQTFHPSLTAYSYKIPR